MRFLPYLCLLISFVLGYLAQPFVFVFVAALLGTALIMPLRRNQLRSQPQAPDRNMVLDGAFLVFQQTLVHFVAFGLGVFLMRMMGG
ncbi:MAG: hypothetical protein AAFP97_06085 [Pseudomonadota bacterium]